MLYVFAREAGDIDGWNGEVLVLFTFWVGQLDDA
jgi:hypothetical protein